MSKRERSASNKLSIDNRPKNRSKQDDFIETSSDSNIEEESIFYNDEDNIFGEQELKKTSNSSISITPIYPKEKPKEVNEASNDVSNDDNNYEDLESDNEFCETDVNEDNFKKIASETWKYFKLIEVNDKKTKKKIIKKKFIVQLFDKTVCGKYLANHNSTTSMINHLKTHDIYISKKKTDNKPQNSSSDRTKALNYYLLMFIVTSSLPFRCIDNKFFKLFCKEINPSFKPPNRQKIADLAKDYFKLKKKKLKKKITKALNISLTTDCWTSVQNYSYIALTAHFLDNNFKISSYCLAVRHIIGGHFGCNLSSYISDIMNEYDITSKVTHITSDNASNISNAINKLKINQIHCFGHIMHLIITNTFRGIKKCLNNYSEEPSFSCLKQSFEEDCEELSDALLKNQLKQLNNDFNSCINDNSSILEVFDDGKIFFI